MYNAYKIDNRYLLKRSEVLPFEEPSSGLRLIFFPGAIVNENTSDNCRTDEPESPISQMRDFIGSISSQIPKFDKKYFNRSILDPRERNHWFLKAICLIFGSDDANNFILSMHDINEQIERGLKINQGMHIPGEKDYKWINGFWRPLFYQEDDGVWQPKPMDRILNDLNLTVFIVVSGGSLDFAIMLNSLPKILQSYGINSCNQEEIFSHIRVISIANLASDFNHHWAEGPFQGPKFIVNWKADPFREFFGTTGTDEKTNNLSWIAHGKTEILYAKAPLEIDLLNMGMAKIQNPFGHSSFAVLDTKSPEMRQIRHHLQNWWLGQTQETFHCNNPSPHIFHFKRAQRLQRALLHHILQIPLKSTVTSAIKPLLNSGRSEL